jgi:ArsR family transcriptional regulator
MAKNYKQLAESMKALGHPIRLQIIAGLVKNECNVTQIQQSIGVPQSTISQHLRILKNAGIIEGRRERTNVCYKVINNWIKEVIEKIDK